MYEYIFIGGDIKAVLCRKFTTYLYIILSNYSAVGRNSADGIGTRHGLDGPGIESQWGVRFFAPLQTGPGDHPASYTTRTGSFPGVKRPWCGVDHPPQSRAEVKERIYL